VSSLETQFFTKKFQNRIELSCVIDTLRNNLYLAELVRRNEK